jgi:hypothetical protein
MPLCPARSARGFELLEPARTRARPAGSAREGRIARLAPLERRVNAGGRPRGAALGATERLPADLGASLASSASASGRFVMPVFANRAPPDCNPPCANARPRWRWWVCLEVGQERNAGTVPTHGAEAAAHTRTRSMTAEGKRGSGTSSMASSPISPPSSATALCPLTGETSLSSDPGGTAR